MQDSGIVRIIHVMLDDHASYYTDPNYEDLYVTLIECSEQQALMLCLI